MQARPANTTATRNRRRNETGKGSRRCFMRVLAAIVLACLCAFGATACTSRSAPARPEPLAAVSPMPNPSLAPWIEEISPTGTADENAQIRIRFRNDVIPVESLESPDRAAALSYFSIAPAIPGRFVFYTPRLVGFEADAAAPLATRLRIACSRPSSPTSRAISSTRISRGRSRPRRSRSRGSRPRRRASTPRPSICGRRSKSTRTLRSTPPRSRSVPC